MYMEHMFICRKTADVSVLSSYGSCETKNKRCGSCILTTKLVTRTNYYNKFDREENYLICFWKTDVFCPSCHVVWKICWSKSTDKNTNKQLEKSRGERIQVELVICEK
jgi:hypothetical protein